ncbi:MAG TPA: M1 family aminopeptidase [Burkholderiales bacterium]|nr:M1 family aminopeptidase [Burkholderiales bacterium]
MSGFIRAALLVSFAVIAAGTRAANLDLDVSLDPSTRLLTGTAKLRFQDAEPRTFSLAPEAVIERSAILGRPVVLERTVESGRAVLSVPASVKGQEVVVTYRLPLEPLDTTQDHRGVLRALPPMADVRGSFLPAGSGWYPQPAADFTYTVSLAVPDTQRALVPGRLLREAVSGGLYRADLEFPHPNDGIDLMAGPYTVRERLVAVDGRELRLRTYFGPDLSEAISDDYLAAVERYLRMYSDGIGEYPFDGFSIVASPLPTGLGMPTLTYLGAQVIRLPFIRDTSLGHEVLHSWWGNCVHPDYEHGNWAEGLTTFMADYAYKERADAAAARDMRHGWLRDYASLPADSDKPLVNFTARTHSASATVGYGKAAMILYMMREKIGADAFDRALRAFFHEYRFRHAGWSDLAAAFSKASGQPVARLIEPWINRSGAPAVTVPAAVAERSDSAWELYLLLAQDTPPYPLEVPISIRTANGERTVRVPFRSPRDAVTLTLQSEPLAVVVDPHFQLWRALTPGESPPIVREAIAARDPVLVVLDRQRDFATAAETLAGALLERAPRRADVPGTDALVAVIAGTPARVDAALAKHGLGGRPATVSGQGTAQVWTMRRENQTLLVISARDAAALAALARALPHLGGQSWVVFEGARPVARGTWPAETVPVPVRLTAGP